MCVETVSGVFLTQSRLMCQVWWLVMVNYGELQRVKVCKLLKHPSLLMSWLLLLGATVAWPFHQSPLTFEKRVVCWVTRGCE